MTSGDVEAHRAARLRRLGKNALSLLAAYVLPRGFTVSAIVVAARVLGAQHFGAYGTAAAFAVILSIFSTLGMHTLLVRDLARAPAQAPGVLRAAHQLKTVSNVFMLVLLWALARSVVGLHGEALSAALLLGVSYAVGSYVENLSAYYQAIERMHVWTEASALLGLVTGALGAALVLTTRSVAWFAAAPLVGQLVALGWLLARAPAEIRRGAPASADDRGRLATALAPFAGAFIVLTLHYKLDVLLLERWRADADVGLYTAAYKLVDLFHALVIVAIGALFPALARATAPADAHGPARGARTSGTSRITELALLGAVPAAAALHLAAPATVRLLFGAQYAAAAPALGWLALALPALALNLLGGYLLGAAHRMGRVALLYVGGLAVKTALDAWLIPSQGPTGAAVAMCVAESGLALAMLGSLYGLTGARPRARAWVAAGGAAVLGALATLLPDAAGGLVASGAYLVAVVALYAAVGILHADQGRVLGRALRGGGVPGEPVEARG